MVRKEIHGGWHGENLPGGEFAVSIAKTNVVQTHNGPVTGEELLYTRCCAVGGFKFAGQQQNGTQNVEWAGKFAPVGPSYGVNPVCYDQSTGELLQGAPQFGSQGIRFVEGGIPRTGDETYARVDEIYEWTRQGDVTVGQGPQGGAVAIVGGKTLLVEPGDCRFVRFNREGDLLAITIVKLQEGKTVLLWLIRNEIESFPLYEMSKPSPIDPVNPPKEKDPVSTVTNGPSDDEINRAKEMLALVRREWNFGSNQNDSPYVREVAARLGGNWGLNGKRGDPQNVSHDILAWKVPGSQPVLFDVLVDGGGANGPAFEQLPYPEPAGAVWLDPGLPQSAPGTTKAPQVDLTPFVKAIESLQASNDAIVAFVTNLEARIKVLEVKPAPKFHIKDAGPDGKLSTSRTFGHGHTINLIIEEVK